MKQNALKFGIIAGAVMVIFLLTFHRIDSSLVLNPFVYWSSILVAAVCMVAAVRKERAANDDLISRRAALATAFQVYAIAMLIFHVFVYVLFNFLDSGLLEMQRKTLEAAGRDTAGQDMTMTLSVVMFGYAVSLLGGFMVSWLIATLLKKEPRQRKV